MIRSVAAAPWRAFRPVLTLCISIGVVWFGWQALQDIDPAAFWNALDSIALWQWGAAAGCIWASFAALGRYDGQWHAIMQTGVPPRLAQQVGRASVAIGQTIGMSAVTGGLVRWQCLPQLSTKQTAQISAAVAASFVAAWAVYAAISATIMGLVPLYALIAMAVVSAPVIIAVQRRFAQVTQRDLLRLTVFTGLDLLFAGTALYILMPAGVDIPYHLLIAAFVLALGFGLLANIPAGAGVLEMTLLTLLAPADITPVLAALCAFRMVGYLIPALVAMGFVARLKLRPAPALPDVAGYWDIVRQHGGLVMRDDAVWLRSFAAGLPVTIGNPSQPARPPLVAACYKIGARTALDLRQRGWTVGRIASEAIIAPQNWAATGSTYASLRRKLRKAEAAGVTITMAHDPLPLPQIAQIAAQWSADHGGERGFSMGRYDGRDISQQRVFLINQGDALIGFISFQCHGANWQLDLIRHKRGAADGAMHLAVVSAIEAAHQCGITRLSLAASPDCHLKVGAKIDSACQGLFQFKNSFRPVWTPLYHAAPTRMLFGVSLGAVTWAVQRPVARLIAGFALNITQRHVTPRQR